MKVLHVNEHLALKGGVETYLLSLLPMLEDRGFETHVVYGKGDSELHASSTCVQGVGRVGGGEDDVRESVADVLRRERPDVVHMHNFQNLGALQACLEYGSAVMTSHDYRSVCPANMFFYKRTQEVCPKSGAGPGCFLTTLHKHCLTPRPRYAAYFYRRTRWMMKHSGRFARVIAPSSGARDRLTEAGFEPADIRVLPYFCPLEPRDEPRPRPDVPTITFMGRIAPNKGQETFVEALGWLPEEVEGVLVGDVDGPKRTEVERLAERFGCTDRLNIRAWASRDEVVGILDRSSVFIFPSLWEETLGIVGLEALSRGVPVVASDLGGVSEWLRDDENGYVVPPKSAEGIRDAVMRILSSDRRLEAFGRAGIRTIREKFMPADHTDQLVRLYRDIAGRS